MRIRSVAVMSNMEKALLIILVMALYKFFFLFDGHSSLLVNGVYGPSTKTLDAISLLLLMSIVVTSKKIKKSKFFVEILIAETIIIISAIITAPDVFLKKWISYGVLLVLYFSLINYLKNKDQIVFFVTIMQLCGIVTNILLISQAAIMNNGGNPFLHIYFLESGYWYPYRNGMLRITENEVLYLLTYCISVSQIRISVSNKSSLKLIALMNITTTLINFFYVTQTRLIMMMAILILLINVFIRKKLTEKQLFTRFVLIVGASISAGFVYDKIMRGLRFSITENSYIARIEGYKYFLNLGIEHPFMGVGFSDLLDANGINYTDVGIIGTFGQFGVILVFLYVIILIKLVYLTVKNQHGSFRMGRYISINSSFMVVFLSFTTMSMFNNGSLQIFAVVLALIESINRNTKIQNTKK